MWIIVALVIAAIYLFWYKKFELASTSNYLVLSSPRGDTIKTIFIEKDDIIRFRIVDERYSDRKLSESFFTILDESSLFINEGTPTIIFKDSYLFDQKSKKMNYIGEVQNMDNQLKFSGFKFYEIILGSTTDTFSITKGTKSI